MSKLTADKDGVEYQYEDIKKILMGATLMGSGGGGPIDVALNMLEEFKDSSIMVYGIDKMPEGVKAAVIAAMGSPDAVQGQAFGKLLTNTYQCMKDKLGEEEPLIGCIPVEYGGFNTFAPIYLALSDNSIVIFDADGSGRAVPALDTTYLSLAGCPISPIVMSNETNDCVYMECEGSQLTTKFVEDVCRTMCSEEAYGQVAGLGAWTMNSDQIQSYTLAGDIERAFQVGNFMEEYSKLEEPSIGFFEYLNQCMSRSAAFAGEMSPIIMELGSNVENQSCMLTSYRTMTTPKGFDAGEVIITSVNANGISDKWTILYLNESLIISRNDKYFMTAPDLICIYDETIQMPVSNDYIEKYHEEMIENQHKLSLGIMRINHKWEALSDQFDEVWSSYFKELGYEGACIRFPYHHC